MTGARLKALLSEYGSVAISVYLVLWVLVLAGFATAITLGFAVDQAAEGVGVLGGAWLATKVTQPIRIGVTIVLTPFVARVLERFGWVRPGQAVAEPEPPK